MVSGRLHLGGEGIRLRSTLGRIMDGIRLADLHAEGTKSKALLSGPFRWAHRATIGAMHFSEVLEHGLFRQTDQVTHHTPEFQGAWLRVNWCCGRRSGRH